MINILNKLAELNAKYGQMFVGQSKRSAETKKIESENGSEQSKRNRTFQNNRMGTLVKTNSLERTQKKI